MSQVFYSRVSSISQKEDRQLNEFKKLEGYTKSKLYLDKCSGSIPFLERPEAFKLWEHVTTSSKDKTIVVKDISRLGRNTANILKTVEKFTELGICIHSLREGIKTLTPEGKINPIATVVFSVMASISEMERLRIKEAQAEGIANAKMKGVYLKNGLNKKGKTQSKETILKNHKDIVRCLELGSTTKDIVKNTGKSTATITKVRKLYNEGN